MTDPCYKFFDLVKSLFLHEILAVDKLKFLFKVSQHLDGACDLTTQLRQLLHHDNDI